MASKKITLTKSWEIDVADVNDMAKSLGGLNILYQPNPRDVQLSYYMRTATGEMAEKPLIIWASKMGEDGEVLIDAIEVGFALVVAAK